MTAIQLPVYVRVRPLPHYQAKGGIPVLRLAHGNVDIRITPCTGGFWRVTWTGAEPLALATIGSEQLKQWFSQEEVTLASTGSKTHQLTIRAEPEVRQAVMDFITASR